MLPGGKLARNVAILIGGTLIAQGLAVVTAPVLSRLYSPADYGVFNLFSSIGLIIGMLASLRYEPAIVLAEKDEEAANVLRLCFSICVCTAGVTLLGVALFRQGIANLFNTPKLVFWLWFMPVSIIASGSFFALNYWSMRRKQFKRLAGRQVTNSAATALTQIGGAAIWHPGAGGLIGGALIGQLAATGRLAWQVFKDEGKEIIAAVEHKSMSHILCRYKKFPIYDSWSVLLNTSSTLMPVLLLAYFFNPAIVGFYTFGSKIITVPMGVIGDGVTRVFYPRAAEGRRAGDLGAVALKMFDALLGISCAPILLITIVAPDLFKIAFGPEWVTAGEYVRWLSVFMLLTFVSAPLSPIFFVMERQREGLIIYIFAFIIRVSSLVIGGMRGDALFTIGLFAVSETIFRIFSCCYILRMAGIGISRTIRSFIREILRSGPYSLIPLLFWQLSHDSLLYVAGGIGAGILFLILKAYEIRKGGGIL